MAAYAGAPPPSNPRYAYACKYSLAFNGAKFVYRNIESYMYINAQQVLSPLTLNNYK